VIQISPPLVAEQAQFDEMTGILGEALTEAGERMSRAPSTPAPDSAVRRDPR
jgi:hypothetical protein